MGIEHGPTAQRKSITKFLSAAVRWYREYREAIELRFQVKRCESHGVSTNLNVAVLGTLKRPGCVCFEILDMGGMDLVGMDLHCRIVLSAALVTCTPDVQRSHQRGRTEQ